MVAPGGGTVEIIVEVLTTLLVSRTSPPIVVIVVPLTVRVPPSGAFGGIELVFALAARAMKAAKVLPVVGLYLLAGDTV